MLLPLLPFSRETEPRHSIELFSCFPTATRGGAKETKKKKSIMPLQGAAYPKLFVFFLDAGLCLG